MVKTGMLLNHGIISAVAGTVSGLRLPNLVVDSVMVAESGAVLLEPEAVGTHKNELFALAAVVTPNMNEAFALLTPLGESSCRWQRSCERYASTAAPSLP